MRRLARRLAQGELDHLIDDRRRQGRQAGLARLVAQEPGHALAHEALLPAPNAGLRDPGLTHDLGRAAALGRCQDDPRPPHVLLTAVAIRHDPLQTVTVRGANLDLDSLAHATAYDKRQ